MTTATKKVCSRGHAFLKSTDVPTCPVCWPGRYTHKMKAPVIAAQEEQLLNDLRSIIQNVGTKSFVATVAYGMPAYRYKAKIVCCFSLHKNHLGFYPYSGHILTLPVFEKALSKYKWAKGSVQFPKDKKLPSALIKKILKVRMSEIDKV
jgi:uncharacterized protein YdhG (YjbR/CyaY superfamily)